MLETFYFLLIYPVLNLFMEFFLFQMRKKHIGLKKNLIFKPEQKNLFRNIQQQKKPTKKS